MKLVRDFGCIQLVALDDGRLSFAMNSKVKLLTPAQVFDLAATMAWWADENGGVGDLPAEWPGKPLTEGSYIC